MGHAQVHIPDGRVCPHIAKTSYTAQLWARSINVAVSELGEEFARVNSQEHEEVTEASNEQPLAKYTVKLNPDYETGDRIAVMRDRKTEVTEG